MGRVSAPAAFTEAGMSSVIGPTGAVGARDGLGGPRRGGPRAVHRHRAAVGRHVDVPGVGGRLLEVVGQRHGLATLVEDRQRGGVVVGGRVAEVDGRRRGRQGDAGARVEVHLHRDLGRLRRLDAGGGQLQRAGHAGLDRALAVGRVAHQLRAGVRDDVAVLVDLELAVAGVERLAVLLHLEEAGAVDGEVQRIGGGRHAALGELLGHRDQADADAAATATAGTQRRGVHVAELGARGLGTVGIGIGDVVADDVEVLAGGVETGETLLEAHGMFLVRAGVIS
jgi:hypothetical protein